MKTTRSASSALKTLDATIATEERNLSSWMAAGVPVAQKLAELAALRARRAELAAR